MEIVRFKDGTFAVRRWFFGYEFLDKYNDKAGQNRWWRLLENDCYFKMSSYDEAVERLKIIPDYGKPLKHRRS